HSAARGPQPACSGLVRLSGRVRRVRCRGASAGILPHVPGGGGRPWRGTYVARGHGSAILRILSVWTMLRRTCASYETENPLHLHDALSMWSWGSSTSDTSTQLVPALSVGCAGPPLVEATDAVAIMSRTACVRGAVARLGAGRIRDV